MVLSAGARRLSEDTFAVESAFAQHLRDLRALLQPRFEEIVVAMGELCAADYERLRSGMSVVDERREKIRFVPLFPYGASRTTFWRRWPRTLKQIVACVRSAGFVHSHLSFDVFRPVELAASIVGKVMMKPVIAITDMDNRKDADMNYRTGVWGRRQYLMCKAVYDPLRDLQQRLYVRTLDMVLFKELQQVEDYGKGAPHVRLFLDPNFAEDLIADEQRVEEKLRALRDPAVPLKLIYFGRLVRYKGVEKMLESIARARTGGAHLELDILGEGPEKPQLLELVGRRGLIDVVRWLEPRPYGPEFFDALYDRHLLLACPLSADTPRSAWDAMAAGVPILAYDTPFYRGLGKLSGAVDVVPWLDVDAFADRLVALAKDKSVLSSRVTNAVRAAVENTGRAWLKRRADWVEELFSQRRYSSIGKLVSFSGGGGRLAGRSRTSG